MMNPLSVGWPVGWLVHLMIEWLVGRSVIIIHAGENIYSIAYIGELISQHPPIFRASLLEQQQREAEARKKKEKEEAEQREKQK